MGLPPGKRSSGYREYGSRFAAACKRRSRILQRGNEKLRHAGDRRQSRLTGGAGLDYHRRRVPMRKEAPMMRPDVSRIPVIDLLVTATAFALVGLAGCSQ